MREILDDDAPRDETPRPQALRAEFIGNAVTLPAGTVIVTQMLTSLTSKTASAGDRLRAKVIQPVNYQGRTVIPAGSIVEGQVLDVVRARSRRRSGMIEISFDRLRLDNKTSLPLEAALVPASDSERKQFNEDGTLSRKGNETKRTAAFIGGGVGAGAVIGYVAGGALFGAGIGAGVGVAVALLAKGQEAVVEPGMKIGAELLEPIQLRAVPVAEVGATEGGQPLVPYRNPRNNETNVANNPPRDYPLDEPVAVPRPKQPVKVPPKMPSAAPRPVTPPVKTPVPRRPPSNNEPVDKGGTGTERDTLELLSITNVLAERGSDDTVRISLTAQTPTAGWKLLPEEKIQNGVLQIKVLGAPPRSLAAQVISSATTVIVKPDPDRLIQRVTVRGANGERTTVPMTRSNRNSGNESPVPVPVGEALSSMGLRIADKSAALVEDYARFLRAWKQANGAYSFENPRDAGAPEAQLLHSFDRLSEAANVFRSALTTEAKRRATRDLTNSHAQINRLWAFVKVPVEFKQRWEEIERDTKQLSASVPAGSLAPGSPNQPRRARG